MDKGAKEVSDLSEREVASRIRQPGGGRNPYAAVKNRNAQFENIAKLKAEFEKAGNPIVSMDAQKKEQLGNLYRDGHLYTLEELQTYDHDFPSYAEGVLIPHTIYDLQLNVGYIQNWFWLDQVRPCPKFKLTTDCTGFHRYNLWLIISLDWP